MTTSADPSPEEAGFHGQVGVWDGRADPYVRDSDARFQPVTEQELARAALQPAQR